jgi:hypothetical protein
LPVQRFDAGASGNVDFSVGGGSLADPACLDKAVVDARMNPLKQAA